MPNDYSSLHPIILLTVLALFIIMLDIFLPKKKPAFLGWLVAIGGLIILLIDWHSPDAKLWYGLVNFTSYSRAFDTIFLLTLITVSIASVAEEGAMSFRGEYYGLLIFSTVGLMLIASSGGLLMLYLGIELTSMCLFTLVGFAKREKRSAEAALKMFVIGAIASAVMLYGISILYGVLGSTQFDRMSLAVAHLDAAQSMALWLGVAFTLAGIGFKITAAPFHMWAPDVYEGAPTTITAYLSTASKTGGVAALLQFILLGMHSALLEWTPIIMLLAVLSMIVGNLVALVQTNLKRLLAYSGIAQMGYIMVAIAGMQATNGSMSVASAYVYLLLYSFTNVGGFLIAQAIADVTGSTEVSALKGLHRRSAPLAFGMLIVLFSLGGIPPLAGFVGKLYLFAAGWSGGQHLLVLLGAIVSVVSLYYYLMVALQVYIKDPEEESRITVHSSLSAAISICVVATILIGAYPRPWVELGQYAASGLQRDSTMHIARLKSDVCVRSFGSVPIAPLKITEK